MTNTLIKSERAPENLWLYTFVISALIYLVSLYFAPYLGQFALKAFPILILVFASFYHLKAPLQKLMVAALICSAIGDVFLAPSAAYHFIVGLGAFLIAQIIYCRLFLSFKSSTPNTTQWLQAATLTCYAIVMALVVLPDTGELMIPVVFYLLVISAMGVLALLSRCHRLVKLGALIFICSDSILAWGLFKTPFPANDLWVMLTYYAAQIFILLGMIKTTNQRELWK